ncbi:MAG: family 20 glycosylhydrolase [Caulobacteraceae bacterium]|nr:family 20 glycosylhydrolase [Caulobacteraceae bacterium]
MGRGLGSIALLALALAGPAAAQAASLTLDVIPEPQSAAPLPGAPVVVADGTPIMVPAADPEALRTATWLADLVQRTRGLRLAVRTGAAPAGGPAIVLARTAGSNPEAYGLDVGDGRVRISASGSAGLFYGAVTLWQLLTPDAARGPVSLAPVAVQDAPRFSWRGLMIDSARHYQSPAELERVIDWMALHKLNVLHWHLTDDQAWRLEIKRYPRLAEVGGWRVPAGAAARADIDPATGRPRLYGGTYSQDQVRAVVAYAAARNVTIVPEIEMPGHALSALLAYPELGAGDPPPAGAQSDWGQFPYADNIDEQTFGFIDNVLTEVMALFPGRYIHVGGDEASTERWTASPEVQARMKALGLSGVDQVQPYFTRRIEAFLSAHGRRLVGWDEILDGGGLPPGATVMSWHGIDGAAAAARAGHDAILAPAPTLYFDNRQSARPSEPPGRGPVVSLQDVYAFDPVPANAPAQDLGHILGLQGNLWTEHVRTDAQLEAMAFPRAAAVAEAAWTRQDRRSWASFAERLPAQFDRYRALGLRADDAALAIEAEADPAAGGASVVLSTQAGLGQIRYTTDGSAPGPASAAYAGPLALPLPIRLRAQAFEGARPVSPPLDQALDDLSVRRRASQQLSPCEGGLALNLESPTPLAGERPAFLVPPLDACWLYKGADLTGVTRIDVAVGEVPFNFQLAPRDDRIVLHAPRGPEGELEVRLDGCAAAPAAVLKLAAPSPDTGLAVLSGALPPASGKHDLCFSFTSDRLDPIHTIGWVQLVPAAKARE